MLILINGRVTSVELGGHVTGSLNSKVTRSAQSERLNALEKIGLLQRHLAEPFCHAFRVLSELSGQPLFASV